MGLRDRIADRQHRGEVVASPTERRRLSVSAVTTLVRFVAELVN
jgi:hypothetical protein